MKILYKTKGKTQGHLRNIMVEDYQNWLSSTKVWEKYKVSPTTILKWNERNETEWSLENKSSAPINPHRKHSIDKLYLIYYLYKKERLDWEWVIEYLEENNIVFPKSSIYYYLNLWWLVQERKNEGKKVKWEFKKYDPWYLHIDITYWPKIDWKKYYLHIAIDRATRLIYIEIHDNKRAETASKFLENAINFFPFKINKILTDNGKEYTLKHTKWRPRKNKENLENKENKEENIITKEDLKWAFDLVCEAYDIEHRLTIPYTPQTNWMVERLNNTIKSNTIKIHRYSNNSNWIDEMRKDIIWFMLYYILFRKHSSLKKEIWVKTPMEALEYWYNLKPQLFKENIEEFKKKLEKIRMNL